MDTDTIAIIGLGIALTGLGVTLLIILLRGFFRLGRLFQRIDAQDENIRQMRDDIQLLTAEMRENNNRLTTEMRENHRQLTAEMRENNNRLTAEMRENHRQLTADIRQTNETVIALANHRQDQDGNIIFILPVQPGG